MKSFYAVSKIICVIIFSFFVGVHFSYAQNPSVIQLQKSIDNKNAEKQELLKEAERIENELTEIAGQKSSISKEISVINQERKGLENQLAQTQNNIGRIDLEINQSKKLIEKHNNDISNHVQTIEQSFRMIDANYNFSYFEFLISSKNISDFFQQADLLRQLHKPLWGATDRLIQTKSQLRKETEVLGEQQNELQVEQRILDDQKSIVAEQERAKQGLLNQTKNKESEYQKNLAKTLAVIAALDAEIRDFESKLEFALNPNSLPEKGSEVFAWPLDSVFITQRFGKTVSSERLYVSGSHSGTDFRAAVGTPVYAVADGTVKGIGDTDNTCPRASFGKWIFIEHDIGLSTTYGHLSKWIVNEGDQVKKGDLIAYSGNTGRSTGPHLHLTVYATEGVNGQEGVRITNRPSAACSGKIYRMPLAPTAAYLDPLAYLPKTTTSMFKH